MTSQFSFPLHRSPSPAIQAEVGGALLYMSEGICELFSNWVQGNSAGNGRDRKAIAAAINLGRVYQSGRCSYL